MSCPFKPGDRIERIALPPSHNTPGAVPRIGEIATVVRLEAENFENGQNIVILPEDFPHYCRSWSSCWRRIDGPTDQSAESFLRSLLQPQGVQA